MSRIPGKRGLLPQRVGAARFPLKWLHEYYNESDATLPAITYPVDVTHGIASTAWKMLGNGPDSTCTVRPNGIGNCTFAGREHYKMAKAAANNVLTTETWETSNELVDEYLAYDHGQDEGANIADLLLAWYKAGKILAFAPVDHSNRKLSDEAMAAFNGLYVGVSLTDNADELFSEGKPWTVSRTEQPDPSEGHCIVRVKAEGVSSKDLDGYVTWSAEQSATGAWTKACVTEAWVFITTEDQINPVVLAAMQADIDALDGTHH